MRLFCLLFLLTGITLPLNAQVFELKPKEFLDRIKENPGTQVLDLRDAEEYLHFHIPGAVNIQPAEEFFLEEVRDQLSASDTLFIYCRIGKTKEVARLLLENGYRVIYNLKGGSVAWVEYLEKERRKGEKSGR